MNEMGTSSDFCPSSSFLETEVNNYDLDLPKRLLCTPSNLDKPETASPSSSVKISISRCISEDVAEDVLDVSKERLIPAFRNLGSSSSGSLWKTEIMKLQKSQSYSEASTSLQRIREVLHEIHPNERMKLCKSDFKEATNFFKAEQHLWSNRLFKEFIAIDKDFFNPSKFLKLPTDILVEIFFWMSISDIAACFSVSWEWYDIASCDQLWRCLYHRKFLVSNPGPMPLQSFDSRSTFYSRFKLPHIGDKVEVAWRGKFRLETQDVYQGMAWWKAQVSLSNHSWIA